MPKGVYIKTDEHRKKISETLKIKGIRPATCGQPHSEATRKKISEIQKGKIAHNKGIQTEKVIKKFERYKNRLSVNCRKHGDHFKWRLYNKNNVQCLLCCSEWQMNQRRRNPLRFIYRDAKKHAKSYKREFNITLDDLVKINEIQENKCALTGVLFDNDNPPSLDRINSDLGYVLDNIQLILIKVNRMKSNFTQKEFIDICIKIVAYNEARRSKKKKKK